MNFLNCSCSTSISSPNKGILNALDISFASMNAKSFKIDDILSENSKLKINDSGTIYFHILRLILLIETQHSTICKKFMQK